MSILALNSDCIGEVSRFLGFWDLGAFASTCKTWAEISSDRRQAAREISENFRIHPITALQQMQRSTLIPQGIPGMASFLFRGRAHLPNGTVGSVLCSSEICGAALRQSYLEHFDFSDMHLVNAFRYGFPFQYLLQNLTCLADPFFF